MIFFLFRIHYVLLRYKITLKILHFYITVILSNTSIADFTPNATYSKVVGLRNIWYSMNKEDLKSNMTHDHGPTPAPCCWPTAANFEL